MSSYRPAVSQFEKFDQIVAWLFSQTEKPIKIISTIVDRLSRNFRIDRRLGQNDSEQSRTPVLQFISKCDRLAQHLHQVMLRVVRIEGDDVPYVLPEKKDRGGTQKEKLEQVLQHIVGTLDYIFNYMEDDLELLYMFCDMVTVAETKKSPPEAAAKKVFFVVERVKHIQVNLERLQMFVLIKHNGPEPSLVEDLIGLQQLRMRGYLTEDEYEYREVEAIENIVRAFVTKGRFLEQKEQHSLTIKREKPIEIPTSLPDHLQDAILKLKLLLDGGFIDTTEYNARASQIISRWQEERIRLQEERNLALRKAAAEQKKTLVVEEEPSVDNRWDIVDSVADPPVLGSPYVQEPYEEEPVERIQDVVEPEPEAPPPVPDFEDEPPPVPEFNEMVSPRTVEDDEPPPPSVPEFTLEDDNEDDNRWENPPVGGGVVRINKPLPAPVPQSQPEPAVEVTAPPKMGGEVSSEEAAMAKLSAALEQQAAAKAAREAQQPSPPKPVSPPTSPASDADAAMAKLTAALEQQAAAKAAAAAANPERTTSATSPTNVPKARRGSRIGGASGLLSGSNKGGQKRGSLFARQQQQQQVQQNSGGSSPVTASSILASKMAPEEKMGVSGGPFDDLSLLQLTAKKRNDPDAFRIHSAEKKMGVKDLINIKGCIDKTYVCDGHSINVKLFVSNQSKKSVNCVKFILQTGSDERVVNTVEDATRDEEEGGDPVFPLGKRSWKGDISYMLPVNVAAGFYKLRVQLFYNTRYNIELPIGLHILSKEEMWKHNPLQVFGTPLDEVLRREGGRIPLAVARPLEALCNDTCLCQEGIFRMSGDLTKILEVRDDMDSGKAPTFAKFVSTGSAQAIHMVAGVMKLFLRLLPEPLFSEVLYDELLSAHSSAKNGSDAEKLQAYKPLVARIPESGRVLFATLSDFINRFLIPHKDMNKMTHSNLSVIFGPVFVWRANLSPMEELSNASRVNGVVQQFFELGRDLFPEVVPLQGVPALEGGTGAGKGALKVQKVVERPTTTELPKKKMMMGTNRGSSGGIPKAGGRSSGSSGGMPKASPPAAPSVGKSVQGTGGAGAGSTESLDSSLSKPLKPLPPIPRSAMTASQQKLAQIRDEEDDEEEEQSE